MKKLTLLEAMARKEGYNIHRPMNRATRNNNPGNLEWGPFAREHGATHIEVIPEGYISSPRFAYFPSIELGWKAMRTRLLTGMYKGLTLRQAIYKWAPPTENDTESYIKYVAHHTGHSEHDYVKDILREEEEK